MAFTADFTITKASADSIKVTDNSSWGSALTSDFSARTITITNHLEETPDGMEASIDFPFDAGFGDELTITLPKDLAMNISISYTAVIPDSVMSWRMDSISSADMHVPACADSVSWP